MGFGGASRTRFSDGIGRLESPPVGGIHVVCLGEFKGPADIACVVWLWYGTGMQEISGNQGMRCLNCPTKGCYNCPMFGVGHNPEYLKVSQGPRGMGWRVWGARL
jgi:hypothetical protein